MITTHPRSPTEQALLIFVAFPLHPVRPIRPARAVLDLPFRDQTPASHQTAHQCAPTDQHQYF